MGRGHASRFVEHDPAMNVVSRLCALSFIPACPRFYHISVSPRAIRAMRRSWRHIRNSESALKRISGANFRSMRRAISPRKTFLCRSSAARTSAMLLPPSGMTKIVASFRSGLMRTSGIVIDLLSRTGSPDRRTNQKLGHGMADKLGHAEHPLRRLAALLVVNSGHGFFRANCSSRFLGEGAVQFELARATRHPASTQAAREPGSPRARRALRFDLVAKSERK